MRALRKAYTSALLLLLSGPAAHAADILAFDFNFSPEEIHELEKYRDAEIKAGRPSRLVVIPPTTAADRILKQKIFVQQEANWRAMNKCKTPPECDALKLKDKALFDQMETLYKKYRMSREQIGAAVAQACKAPSKFDRVFLSGHDGTGDFYGTIANLSLPDMKTVVNQNPACLKNSVKGVYAWACYTATTGKSQSLWPSVFPKAQMVAGYDGLAPRSDRDGNLHLLQGLMQYQDKLLDSRDLAQLKGMLGSIKDINDVNSAIYLRPCDLYSSKGGVETMAAAKAKRCARAAASYDKTRSVFACYWEAQKRCPASPENTDDSELRTAYNFLQESEQCFDSVPASADKPDTSRTIRLIFYKTVMANVARVYANDIAGLNASLDKLGVPPELKVPNLTADKPPSRRDILDWGHALRKYLQDQRPGLVAPQTASAFANLEQKLLNLQCVPFGWVEPNAQVPPAC